MLRSTVSCHQGLKTGRLTFQPNATAGDFTDDFFFLSEVVEAVLISEIVWCSVD